MDAERMRPELVEASLSLTERDRETFLLVTLGDLTYQEAATALQISLGTVRSRIHRSREKLRAHIERYPVFDPSTVPGPSTQSEREPAVGQQLEVLELLQVLEQPVAATLVNAHQYSGVSRNVKNEQLVVRGRSKD